MDKIKVGVVGATGMVGQRFVQLLANHPWFELSVVAASDRSAGLTYGEATRWLLPEPMPESAREMMVQEPSFDMECEIVFCALPSDVAAPLEERLAEEGYLVCSNASFIEGLRKLQGVLGGIPEPQAAYLIIRGLKTFALRVEQQNKSSLSIARFLRDHPKIEMVYYPGLEHHHNYNVAKKQMKGFGGLISFEVKASLKEISKFIDSCKIPYIAPSMGGCESLIEQPPLMSFYELTPEERKSLGISEQLVRYSVGLEDSQDLIDDLDQALKVIP